MAVPLREKLAFLAQGHLDHLYFEKKSFINSISEWFCNLFIPECEYVDQETKIICHNKGEPCYLPPTDPDKDILVEWNCYKHKAQAGYCKGCGTFCAGIESFDFGKDKGFCDNCGYERRADREREEEEYEDYDDYSSDAYLEEIMKIKPIFRWFDFWVGFYWAEEDKILYWFYFPMCGFMISWQRCFGSCNKPIFMYDGNGFCGEPDCYPF